MVPLLSSGFVLKASLGPYAWEDHLSHVSTTRNPRSDHGPLKDAITGEKPETGFEPNPSRDPQHLRYLRDPELKNLPRAAEVFSKIDNDMKICLHLPKIGASAGQVLKHAFDCFHGLHSKHAPMTFKFGITHDRVFRFHNDMWGYRHSFDQFEMMIVLLAAENPVATAYLEAALINQFSRPMAERKSCTKANAVLSMLYTGDGTCIGSCLCFV